jgi:hypothetical protein
VAVIVFDTDAIRNNVSGVTGLSCSICASPAAAAQTSRPFLDDRRRQPGHVEGLQLARQVRSTSWQWCLGRTSHGCRHDAQLFRLRFGEGRALGPVGGGSK